MTTTIANKWQILDTSNKRCIHLQHVDYPGLITILEDDQGFVLDVWPDVGHQSATRVSVCYDDLRADGPKI